MMGTFRTSSPTPTRPGSLPNRVAAFARARNLWQPGERILVAVSGGPDSVALLALLTALAQSCALTLEAIHVNHGLRGEESEEDARFVARLCERLGVPLHQERVDPVEMARRRKGRSLQELARDARYAAFEQVGAALGVERIALGHTADDQAETLVMWMLRGSGSRGLAGIPASRRPWFIRPLLAVSRGELLAYLRDQGLAYRVDSSNAKPWYLRNRVRQEVLPALKRINPSLVRVLARQGDILGEEDRYLEARTAEVLNGLVEARGGDLVLARAGLAALPLAMQRRAVRALVGRAKGSVKGLSYRAVEDILNRILHGRSGSVLTVSGVEVSREYEVLRFRPVGSSGLKPSPVRLPVTVPSTILWPPTGQVIELTLEPGPDPSLCSRGLAAPSRAVLDADRFSLDGLAVRTRLPGDAFQPAGMGGRRKKLQDFFTDLKLARLHRERVPLLVAPEGILWVGGYRADHRFAATPASTRLLRAELIAGRGA